MTPKSERLAQKDIFLTSKKVEYHVERVSTHDQLRKPATTLGDRKRPITFPLTEVPPPAQARRSERVSTPGGPAPPAAATRP